MMTHDYLVSADHRARLDQADRLRGTHAAVRARRRTRQTRRSVLRARLLRAS